MNGRIVTALLLAVSAATGQQPPPVRPGPPGQEEDLKLPDGTSQREAILKADHAKSRQDAAELIRLSEEVKDDLEKNDRHVLSIGTLRKLDELEKIIRRIRGRMKRY